MTEEVSVMVDRIRGDDTIVEEMDLAREQAERLRWINRHIREASEADLIEDAVEVEDEEEPLATSEV
jgi:hypothetical protein